MDTGAQWSPSLSQRRETGKEAGWGPHCPPALPDPGPWRQAPLGRPGPRDAPKATCRRRRPGARCQHRRSEHRPQPRAGAPASQGCAGLRPRPLGADLPGVGALAFQEPSPGDLSQAAGGPRSPAVFGAIVSYVEQFFETVGISLAERQVRPSPFSP